MGESEGSWLMILKAIFEFKLFGSSASVALSLITSVSRNQGKLIANGQFAFLLLYVIVYCFSNKVLGLIGLHNVHSTIFALYFFNILISQLLSIPLH